MLVLIVLLFTVSIVDAAEPSTILAPIGQIKQGESLTIQGTTSLQEVIVQIMRPNQTLLEMDQLTKSELLAGKTVTLPMHAPLGSYTVKLGMGSDVSVATFVVVANGGGDPNPGTDPGTDPGTNPGTNPGTTPGTDPGADPETDPGTEPAETPAAPGLPGEKPDGSGELAIQAVGKPDAAGVAKAAVTLEALDEAFASVQGAAASKLTLDVQKVGGAQAYETTLPAAALSEGGKLRELTLRTEFGSLTLPSNMFTTAAIAGTANVSITIRHVGADNLPAQARAAIGNRPIVDIQVMLDGQPVPWANDQTPVSVSIPYQPTIMELNNPENITVWYLDERGMPVPVTSGKYDEQSGQVTFITTHFSRYAVVYVTKTFGDIAAFPWAKKQIEALAAKGIIAGTSEGSFSPAASIKRADFVILLMRTLGMTAPAGEKFADVNASDYYHDAVQTARTLGITQGFGDNQFKPNQTISRQEMMTLTARALTIAGKLAPVGSGGNLAAFKDAADVASYASDSIQALIGQGIIEGSNGLLLPWASTSRAETAVMLYRIYHRSGGM
ncbi:hypothetical protein A8708_26880 [Paenibacillus oryzisoli]|uniref:SLH domain-containing protein n=2 Tax=Paenibacillus oryzisoli TaxID=1850517 RepID=A0A198AE59_9BACL|nr:hypothetical protein A8708_26880 [Paenibacillus oryzisoli]